MPRVAKTRVVEGDPVCHWNVFWERLARGLKTAFAADMVSKLKRNAIEVFY